MLCMASDCGSFNVNAADSKAALVSVAVYSRKIKDEPAEDPVNCASPAPVPMVVVVPGGMLSIWVLSADSVP